jgi:hypothetical protein
MIKSLPWILVVGMTATQDTVPISDTNRLDAIGQRCLTMASDSLAPPRFAEAHAATDPRDPDHLVAAWQVTGGASGLILTATSWDGGSTWSAPKALPFSACAGGPAPALRASDPWVAIGPNGRAHVAAIGWNPGRDGGSDGYNALIVVSSADGGRNWGDPVQVAVADTAAGISHDNVSLAADPSRAGRLYLTTTRYAPVRDTTGRTRRVGSTGFTHSADGGATWAPLRTISSPELTAGRVSAPELLVDPGDGRLMVFYLRLGGGARIAWQSSSDAGGTWSAEQQIAPAVQAVSEIESLLPNGRSFVLAPDIVHAALDSRRGALYVAFADGRRDPRGRTGVSLIASFDHGVTWGEPIPVSPTDPVTGWLPSVAVSPDGEVGVAYLTADLALPPDSIVLAYRLRRFRNAGDRLEDMGEAVLDRAGLAWPGDYHALVRSSARYRLITVRSTADRGRGHSTEVVAR